MLQSTEADAIATAVEPPVHDQLQLADLDKWPVAAGWRSLVDGFFQSATGQGLLEFLAQRLQAGASIFPPQPLRALLLTPPESVRVVVLGQDPYHGRGQAEGLAFSVAPGVPLPPSLRNIFKELQRDLGTPFPEMPKPGGSLVKWAQKGVLLLNTCLTVEEGQPASHAQRGWEALTTALLERVACKESPVAFLLWGAHAQGKQGLIEACAAARPAGAAAHLLLSANHPSPLSALRPPKPFLGCDHFGQTNAYLVGLNQPPIDW
jgi:uracil-DNA glycosylase